MFDHQKIGVNAFHWNNQQHLSPYSFIRLYTSWAWIERGEGKYRFEPAYGASAMYDTWLSQQQQAGREVCYVMNISPAWITGDVAEYAERKEWLPSRFDGTLPEHYREFSNACFQVAARYGRQQHPDNALQIDPSEDWTNQGVNQKRSGLGLLKHIEIWNEPDKWWLRGGNNARGYITPVQYGCMLYAAYTEIKRADPSMNVVMAGLTNFDMDYFTQLVSFCKSKFGIFPADVVSFHHYCNATGGVEQGFTVGVSPHEDTLYEKLTGVVKEVKRQCGANMPVWYTEFGWDTVKGGYQSVPDNEKYNAETIQGAWLVAAYCDALRAGVDRIAAYWLADENTATGMFASCGVVNSNGTAKQSYYIVDEFVSKIKGMDYTWTKMSAQHTIVQFSNSSGTMNVVYSNTLTPSPVNVPAHGTFEVGPVPQYFFTRKKRTITKIVDLLKKIFNGKEQ